MRPVLRAATWLLRRARCELAFTLPFAFLAGGVYGYDLSEEAWGAFSPRLAAGCGLGLAVLIGIQITLEAAVVEAFGGRDGRWGPLVAYLWDVGTGAAVGFPLMLVTGAGTMPSVGLALTIGAAWGYVIGGVVCGEGTEALLSTLLVGGAGARRPTYSHIQAMEAQGNLSGAMAAWRGALEADPSDPAPYLALARLLPGREGGPQEAVELLREALVRARLTPEQEHLVLVRIVDLRESQGRRPAAAPDLARYLDLDRPGPATEWARRVLGEIKASLAEEPPTA